MTETSTPRTRDERRRDAEKKGSVGRELILIVGIALVLSVLVRTFVAQAFYVPSESMQNTLQVQDRILVSKLSTEFGGVQRGDLACVALVGGADPCRPVRESGSQCRAGQPIAGPDAFAQRLIVVTHGVVTEGR